MSRQSTVNFLHITDNCKLENNLKNADKPTDVHKIKELTAVIEIIKNKFYFATLISDKKEPRNTPNIYLFHVDDELVYNNYYDDFGPLNIACLYKYCHGVNQILKNPAYKFVQIVHFTSTNAEKRANAAYLAASYSVLYLNQTPKKAYELMTSKNAPNLKPFQDASQGASSYTIKLIDCLNALSKAVSCGFFDFADFDVKEYEKYENLKNGDLNWIVPRKFVAFLGPSTENGSMSQYPEKHLNYFMKNEVVAVIRLNRKAYESFRFTNAGILHYDMFFPDGTVPPKKILKQFLHVAETTRGAVAVHCKAGLGRTGTLIAAYVMKHYAMSAREAIAWLRICRPGSVIGQQQTWLEEMENVLLREGRRYRLKYHGDADLILHHKRGIYSIEAKFDRKVRFREYLGKENFLRTKSEKFKMFNENHFNARCSSAYKNSEHKTLTNQKSKDEEYNKTITQGDKLNEIKKKRCSVKTRGSLDNPKTCVNSNIR